MFKNNLKKIAIVTGGAGFIGFPLTKTLLGEGHIVRVVDPILELVYPDSGRLKRIESLSQENFTFSRMSANDISLEDIGRVDVVINLAAVPGLLPSWTNFELYTLNNLSLVGHLADLCSVSGVPLVHASTSSVFGERGTPGSPMLPNSPYGLTKLAAEHALQAYGKSKGLRFTILRLYSVYGPNQRPDQFFRTIVEKLINDEVIPITGDGLQTRSNAFLSDVVEAFVSSITKEPLQCAVDICGEEEVTLLEVIEKIAFLLDKKPKLSFTDARPGDQRETAGDLSGTLAKFGWKPRTKIDEGLKRMVDSLTAEST
jgi:nucleoside-diphosphate-sugar epimerase